jgi:hypothetical protein
VLERISQIRAALAGAVSDAEGIAAARRTIARVFREFTVRIDGPVSGYTDEYLDMHAGSTWIWLEPIARDDALELVPLTLPSDRSSSAGAPAASGQLAERTHPSG